VSQELVLLGETDNYEPLCRSCFDTARAAQEDTTAKQQHGR
jgi:thymidine kinase